MAEKNHTAIYFAGGEKEKTLNVQAPPSVVQATLAQAARQGELCKCLLSRSSEEIWVNPHWVAYVRGIGSAESSTPRSGPAATGGLRDRAL